MKKPKLKVVFFGTPDFVIPVLTTLIKNFDVVGVVTAPDKAVGRKQILTPSPINLASQAEGLRGYNLKIFTPEKLDEELAKKIYKLKSDLFVMASYGKIIPQFILDIPKFGAINIHPSLLPKYRGPSPIQSAILNGDKISGISIMKMDAKMDHGPVIYAEEFRLSSLDNFQTLSINMFLRSAEILSKIITAFISGKLILTSQDDIKATYCKLVTKEDGYFDIDNPASPVKLDQMVRAYYPWPTAWTKWEGKIVKFLPGNMVQLEGKKPVQLEDFLRGYPNFPLKS